MWVITDGHQEPGLKGQRVPKGQRQQENPGRRQLKMVCRLNEFGESGGFQKTKLRGIRSERRQGCRDREER